MVQLPHPVSMEGHCDDESAYEHNEKTIPV
jgi:hypothetical protein